MPYTTNEQLYYEVFGDDSAPLIVLISGGGAQLISWDEEFITLITEQGFRVVRFDNRDTGFSARHGGPEDVDGGYNLIDLADDVFSIMDALGVPCAHLVGHSMGGMIAQLAAIHSPARVASIGLLSTLPGQDPRYVLHGDHAELLSTPVRIPRETAVAFAEMLVSAAPATRYDPQVQWHRAAAGLAYDRGYAPEGYARQWAACLRAPERLDDLRTVTIPALVFHGRDDAVVHYSAALDLADALAAAELQIHPQVGHLIPHELWPELAGAIVRTAQRGEEAR